MVTIPGVISDALYTAVTRVTKVYKEKASLYDRFLPNFSFYSPPRRVYERVCLCVCPSVRAKECVTRHRIFSSYFTQTARRKDWKNLTLWNFSRCFHSSLFWLLCSSMVFNNLQWSSMIIQYYCTGIITDQSWIIIIIMISDFKLFPS